MNLEQFFQEHPQVALAFSGGVDSAYLLYAALAFGAETTAYFVESQFQPAFELADARRLAAELGAKLKVLDCDVLADSTIEKNPKDRCYHCKNRIFSRILAEAERDGFHTVIDGTNATDDAKDRPGMRALSEMRVLSPLRLCCITKQEVRSRSKAAGLFTWNKPAYACLATRVPTGEMITAEKLAKVEGAEAALARLGFTDFRVRLFGGAARLQLPAGQLTRAAAQRQAVTAALKPYFDIVLLDLEER